MTAHAAEFALTLTAPPRPPHLGAIVGVALSLLVEALAHIGLLLLAACRPFAGGSQ